MLTTTGSIPTERGARYIKQLLSHVGRKVDTEAGDPTSWIRMPDATAELTATSDAVVITASAAEEEKLFRAMAVVQNHIERFGEKDELVTSWDDAEMAGRYEVLRQQWLAERAERKAAEAAEREIERAE